jgi:predicted DNA-binding transcriptional regulator YafY
MTSGARRAPNRSGAGTRLRRLLVMVPWLASQDGPTVQAVCARFGITPKELRDDIELLTFHVGIPPYTPDQFFDLSVEGDRVFARVTPSLDRPLRLTPEEGLALVVAGQALEAEPDGPLARGLAKVAAVLGIDPADAVDVVLGPADASILGTLREAVAGRRRIRIVHYGEARDAALTREVDPWLVTNQGGMWYLVGHDHTRDAERSFRVDRILEAAVLDARARPAPADLHVAPGPGDDAPRVVLDVSPAGRWVAEAYPVDDVEALDDGSIRITLAVGGRSWLERLLLRLGPDAQVVDAPADLLDAGGAAARRVLERYR